MSWRCCARPVGPVGVPLGDSTKAHQVHEEAADSRLSLAADKPRPRTTSASSPTNKYTVSRPAASRAAPSDIVDSQTGDVLGTHAGTFGYTGGQRKGLNLTRPTADGRPATSVDHPGVQHADRRPGRRPEVSTVDADRPGERGSAAEDR